MSRAATTTTRTMNEITSAIKWIDVDSTRPTYEPHNPYRQPGSFATDDDLRQLRIVGRAVSVTESADW